MNNDNINEVEIREFFEKQVSDSGHTFEEEVGKILDGVSFPFAEEIYFDKDQKKGRTIDYVAYQDYPPIMALPKDENKKLVFGQLRFIIECKSLPNHGWVFFGERDELYDDAHLDILVLSDDIHKVIDDNIPFPTLPNFYFASNVSEYIYKNNKAAKKDYNKENNLYEAILAVTKATRHQIEGVNKEYWNESYFNYRTILGFAYFQPLIVFNGHMYKALKKNNKTKLVPIKFAQIRKRYVSENYNEQSGVIHIVHFKALKKYFQIIKQHYWEGDYPVKKQEELVNALSSTMQKKSFLDYLNRKS